MQRFRLTLTSHVWKLARRSNVSSDSKQLHEDVLREVFGLVVAAHELVRDVEHAAPMLADDGVPGGLIAVEASGDDVVHRVRR